MKLHGKITRLNKGGVGFLVARENRKVFGFRFDAVLPGTLNQKAFKEGADVEFEANADGLVEKLRVTG